MKATRQSCGEGEFAVFVENAVVFCAVNSGKDADADEVVAAINGEAERLLAALKAARDFGLDDFKSGEAAIYSQIEDAIAEAEGR